MNTHQIRSFAHVVREGSFVRAAARLGLTQSAVSQHVAKLERAAGTRLLVRGADVVPTRAGSDLFALAERYLTLSQLISDRVEGYRSGQGGHLFVIANAPRPALIYIAEFKRRNPAVHVTFALWDWTTACRLLRERKADIGIITEPERDGDFMIHPVGSAVYAAHLPAAHHLARRANVSLRDLVGETVLLPEEGSYTARTVARKLKDAGLALDDVIRTTSFPLIKEAVLHAVGVGIFLKDCAYPAPGLAARPIVEMPERHATCVVAHAETIGSRTIDGFVDVALTINADEA